MKNKSCILLYHGVTKTNSNGIENCSNKHIKSEEFEKQIKWISENKNVVSLRNIEDKPNSVAVTFDDTFKNVYDIALPILKKYEVPATFFISTAFIGTNKNFWVDRIEHMINFSKKENIEFNDVLYNVNDNYNKINTLTKIKSYLKKCKPSDRENLLNNIELQTGWVDNVEVENYKNLDVDEVKMLDCPPMYEVGGHTVNHEILSYLTDDDLNFEISECIKTLENILKRKIDLFSYPEGQQKHYNQKVINCLKRNGVVICPSAIDGFLGEEDEFNYRRIMVGFQDKKFPFKEYYND